MLWLALLLFTGIGLQLASPRVIRYFLDTTQSNGSRPALLWAAVLFIVFALAQQLLGLGSAYLSLLVGWDATNRLRYDLALHCLRLDLGFHKTHTPGELIERLDGDVTALANFFSQFVLRIAGNGLLVLGILALLFLEDVRIGLGLAAYIALTLAILAAVQRLAASRWAAARQASAGLYGYVEERLSGAEDLRAAGALPYALYRLLLLLRAELHEYRAAHTLSAAVFNFTNVLSVLGYAVGLGFGAYLYTRGEASIGAAYMIVAYVGMLASPLQALREQARDLQQTAASVERIQALFALRPLVVDPPAPTGRPLLPAGPLSVGLDGVTFRYDDGDAAAGGAFALENVACSIAPGRVLGVLGRTGSGKTTLTRLLFRLYDPTAGAIRLSGADLRAVPLAELRARVGMVTQDVQLFQATLCDNLTFFSPRPPGSQADMEAALQALGLWDWARSLPQGLDTPLGAGGQGLSAGEAQRLAFARVFLKDPGLVILDEASSRLDPASEARLERAVDQLLAGRTAIIIAHRLRTVQRADDILILEEGRVVEYGPRLALAADPASRFAHLLQTGLEVTLA
ncbi:MAG: ABC transporter ATP-binding protein [Anaerolineales bacterium]|nr:ABC transporter ATP-binding protein [Anaerolineales bacterium]